MNNNLNTAPTRSISAPNFEIFGAISKAWHATYGTKLTIWGAMFIQLAVLIAASIFFSFLASATGGKQGFIAVTLIPIISACLTWLFTAGYLMLGVRYAQGQPIKASMIFEPFSKAVSIVGLVLLMMLLIIIGFVCLILPGIYLAISYMFALPLLIDKNMGIWQALETSRKMVSSAWFTYFIIFFLMQVIVALSAIPLGLGLIWTVPMTIVLYGLMYHWSFKDL